ncbi:type II toxin-antitoxin system MqsR family toxin [Flavobacterium sp. LB2P6]|uniref:type II toxin-antitoxin system MqsR family toxin n=1 Tax=Flavobacterium sp. LB2P6 TaxID=3401714 RepID=UPI003AAA61F2
MSSKTAVKSFLQELKQVLKTWDIFFVNRPKNSVHDLADLGITANSRKEIIAQLEIEDYCEGPLPETQFNGKELWVFGKIVKKQEIYIKLTISRATGGAICISFHKAAHSLKFPFQENNPE